LFTPGSASPRTAASQKAPRELPPGEYQAPITVPEPKRKAKRLNLPMHDCGPWPEGFTVRREEIYGDEGR
jgi:hypothetical protein